MQFRDLQLQDLPAVQQLADQTESLASDASFATMFIWKDQTHDLFCLRDGFLFRRGVADRRLRSYFPLGTGDVGAALDAIRADAAEAGGLPDFDQLTDRQCEMLRDAGPDLPYTFTAQPNLADYLYNASDLASLSGKKYHAKRNFVNRFEAEYSGRFEIRPITPDLLDAVWAFNRKWCALEGCLAGHSGVTSEACAIARALSNFEPLGLCGLALFVDGAVTAYSLASRISGLAADVHVEKALADVPGAYAVINRAMAQMLAPQYAYLNREEDMGLDGLRQAKQSYHPVQQLMFSTARVTAS